MQQDDLEKLFQENVTLIFRFFRLRTISKETAEDLTSETFVRFVAKKYILENADATSRRSFLYGIAKLVFLEYLRKKYKIEINIDNDSPEFQNYVATYVNDSSNFSKRNSILKKLIANLPEKQKAVISLRLIEHRSLSEIEKILNKDSNYVRTTQKRALANLKKLWECTQSNTGIKELTQDE